MAARLEFVLCKIGLKHAIPAKTRRRLRWLQQYPDVRRLAADRESFRTFRRLSNPAQRGRRGEPRAVRMRPLGGAEILLRPGATDAEVVWLALTVQPHLPTSPPRLIWDLGANIGVTMAHAAHLYPDARIVGLEPDPANAELARVNTHPWKERCEVIEAAVWIEDGSIEFASEAGAESGARISKNSGGLTVQALTLDTLLERTGRPDFVKMDIEGAERAVLNQSVGWAEHVRELVVECHDGYQNDQCATDLAALGFAVEVTPQRLSVDTVRGIRKVSVRTS